MSKRPRRAAARSSGLGVTQAVGQADKQPDSAVLGDLDSPEQIDRFVERFYRRLLEDPQLAPLFLEVAAIELEVHLPHIKAYWRKLLLGDRDYRRHTMNIHRQLHRKQALRPADFQRWLALFTDTVTSNFSGPLADRACRIAATIAANMQQSLLAPQGSGARSPQHSAGLGRGHGPVHRSRRPGKRGRR